MSIDPRILEDNYKFIKDHKNTDLGHIDVANDGHLVKVTWFSWVVRWIVNLCTGSAVDQKVYQAFCAVKVNKFPQVRQLDMVDFINLASRVQYIDNNLFEEVVAHEPARVLDLKDMEEILKQRGVEQFYDVLVEFTKSHSIDVVVNKAFEVTQIARYILKGELLRNLQSKIKTDLSFFNLLPQDTQELLEDFKNRVEEENRQKLEEEARVKAEENLRVTKEKSYILDIALMDLKELIESEEKIDCEKLISMLDNVWEIIQNYPKEIGIPGNTAEVFAEIVNGLTVHISTLNRNQHPVKLLEDTWNKIVDYLGVDARIIIDESQAKANTPVRVFAEVYLQEKLQAKFGMDGGILNANISEMQKIVERVVLDTDSTDPLDILGEIISEIHFLEIDGSDFAFKYLELE